MSASWTAARGLRVLAVSQVPPWPTIGGGYHRAASQMRALARATGVDVELLLVRSDAPQFVDFDGVRLVADVVLPRANHRRMPGWRALKALTSSQPVGINPFIGSRLAIAAAELDLAAYDVHWVFRAEFADVWPSSDVPLVVDIDDIESKKVLQGSNVLSADVSRWHRLIKRFTDTRNARNWAEMQERVARRANAHLVCAPEDLQAIEASSAFVVPNTIVTGARDTREPDIPSIAGRSMQRYVLLHGKLTYAPNADAARWLVRQIAPVVWAADPDVRFHIAGKAPDSLVDELSTDPRIEFLGFVDDMFALVSQAPVVVAPIRFGGGTRLKLIEGAAAGSPMIATTIGAEGLPFTDGTDIILADEPSDFAKAILRLLDDSGLREKLGAAAHTTYREKMSQDAVDESVQIVLESLR